MREQAGLFAAAALTVIMVKLDGIKRNQSEIMDFLKAKERAKLQGNIDTLMDVADNYKYNWDNETYKTNKHILVQDIRRDAEQAIQLYRDQISAVVKAKNRVYMNKMVGDKVDKLQEAFKEYQTSLYLFSCASFLEIVLLGNFNEEYLNNATRKISTLSYEFRTLYTDCYNMTEEISHKSIDTTVAGGLAGASKVVGAAIAKVPVISKGPVDEALIAAGEKLEEKNTARIDGALGRLIEVSENYTLYFVECIEEINRICNRTEGAVICRGNIYFL